ncbi:MAG: sugar phosphate isomerase/epimerase [Acutalibacteraceae bacterium]|nr:sugar phosphate isomerase/epimerase [Acutalibacteraceae bacterium]
MNFGVSSACFYPMDLLESIKLLAENNIHTMEIFTNTLSELSDSFAKDVKKIITPENIEITSIHPFTSGYEHILLFSDYYKRFEDTVEFYKKYFNFAAQLGAKLIVLHGDKRFPSMGGIADEEYFLRYYKLAQTGRAMGVTVAQENVNMFRSQNPEFLKSMREYLGENVDFVLDVKQAVRSKNAPYEICKAMGDRIIHLHINDNDFDNDCLLPGKGIMDYEKLLRVMRQQGFSGKAVIEVYRKNFKSIEDIVKSCNYLNANFGDL